MSFTQFESSGQKVSAGTGTGEDKHFGSGVRSQEGNQLIELLIALAQLSTKERASYSYNS